MVVDSSIRTWIVPPGPFSTFGREERNAVAILFAALLKPANLNAFAEAVGWKVAGLDQSEVSVEWTYVRDLWKHAVDTGVDRRRAVLETLRPDNQSLLEGCSTLDFNAHFGAVPRPSKTEIQFPGSWSIKKFSPNIEHHDEFSRTCIYKWAFNVKPDLVVHCPSGAVLCVEAKWDSAEGVYPANAVEKKIFGERGLKPVHQTTVQRFLVSDLLGFDGTFRYLVRHRPAGSSEETVEWCAVLKALHLSELPTYIQSWAERESNV